MTTNPLFSNLKALEDASFPKSCDKCGRRFNNEKAYIEYTQPHPSSTGLSEGCDEKGQTYVKLIRSCVCGQMILDHFGNRRDDSKKGRVRRQAFEKVIKTLEGKGISSEVAREELLNYMNNKGSKLLESLGIFNG